MSELARYSFIDNEDGPYHCLICGDDLEDGDEVVAMPVPEWGDHGVADVHPGCAARNGFAVAAASQEAPKA